jgi:ParB family chromosome partitioning protein
MSAQAAAARSASPFDDHLGAEFMLPLDAIVGLDHCNVRGPGPDDLETLCASLAAHGQQNPMLLRLLPGVPLRYAVLAGGRRWEALKRLATADPGRWPHVGARLFFGDDADARAASLAENLARADLHPLDVAEALAREVRALGEDRVGRDFGLSLRALRARLRPAARLSERVKAKWRSGEISGAVGHLLATAKLEAQEALLDDPDAAALLANPLAIRQRLASTSISASSPLALFVGEAAYLSAGGEIELELFGQARWLDEALARRLAEAELAAEAAQLRRDEGWGRALTREGFRALEIELGLPALPDFLPDEALALAAIDRAEAAPVLEPNERERLWRDRARIERAGVLRAIPREARSRFVARLDFDSEGRLLIERGLLPLADRVPSSQYEPRSDEPPPPGPTIVAYSAEPPEAGDPPPSPAEPPSPLAGEGGPKGRMRGPGHDAPELAPAARRIAEKAATLAVADAVAGDPAFALAAAIAACAKAGPHAGPVRLECGLGPRGVKTPWLVALAKLSFTDALAAALARPEAELMAGFAEIVAASIELRGGKNGAANALLQAAFNDVAGFQAKVAKAVAAIAENFDYPGFFREASRLTALSAIRDCGGEALERGHSWRDDDSLAQEAARLARAKSWLPSLLRASSPFSPEPREGRGEGSGRDAQAPL